jgi:hypothetical protein
VVGALLGRPGCDDPAGQFVVQPPGERGEVVIKVAISEQADAARQADVQAEGKRGNGAEGGVVRAEQCKGVVEVVLQAALARCFATVEAF